MVLGRSCAGRPRAHLVREGWVVREVADTETKAPGIDLLATRDDRRLAVEVKGFPSTTYDHGPKRGQPKPTQPTNQARQWFSHALLGMMLLRDRRPDAEIATCFPDFQTYRTLGSDTRLPGRWIYTRRSCDLYELTSQPPR